MTALRLVQVLAPDFRNLLRISLFGGLPLMEQPSSRLRARSMRYAHRVKSHLSVLSRPTWFGAVQSAFSATNRSIVLRSFLGLKISDAIQA